MTHNLAENQIAALAPIALVDRKAFADALARVSKVVERRNTIPILSNVRLAGGGESGTSVSAVLVVFGSA